MLLSEYKIYNALTHRSTSSAQALQATLGLKKLSKKATEMLYFENNYQPQILFSAPPLKSKRIEYNLLDTPKA